MAVRDDITVLPYLSPRLIRVESPSTEVTLQDLHDTLRAWEDSVDGETYDVLIQSSGKEPLGGGVFVGVTSALQNALVSFAARTTSVSTGNVTTSNVAGESLIDAAATFVTDGIIPGAWVVNFTDLSCGTVLLVVSETELLVETMADGTDNQLTIGDVYKVWNVIQCDAAGGNLTAVDGVGASIDPIFPTMGTQPVRAAASSSTSQNSSAIQYSSFGGGVSIDVNSPYSGTLYPTGTIESPVNNMADADLIMAQRGFHMVFVTGNLTLATIDASEGHIFVGQSEGLTTITIEPAADVSNCEFQRATVTGTLDGGNTLRECLVTDINVLNGQIDDCGLSGTLVLGGGVEAQILRCYSAVGGAGMPIIDCGGAGQALLVRNYSGGIQFQNKTGADAMSIDMLSGEIIIDADVTGGSFEIRGISKLTDNSGAGATIDTSGLIFADQQQLSSFGGVVYLDSANGVTGTGYPRGTEQNPVSNATDAVAIAVSRGIGIIQLVGDYTMLATDVVDGYVIQSEDPSKSTLTVLDGASMNFVALSKLTLAGVVTGVSVVKGCHFQSVTVKSPGGVGAADVTNCVFEETVTVDPGVVGQFNFFDCKSGHAGLTPAKFDFGGANVSVTVRGYVGDMQIQNFSNVAGPSGTVDILSGAITFDPSCTTGNFILRGACKVTDNSNGTVVDISALMNAQAMQHSVYEDGGVWVDVNNGVAGTSFPVGTPLSPVDNLADAQTIADANGLRKIHVLASLTVAAGPDHTDMLWIGRSPKTTSITIDAGATVSDCEYQHALVLGTLNGNCFITACAVKNLDFISGHLERCVLREGTITLAGAGVGMINRCSSVDAFDAGVGIPEIDFNGAGQTVALQGFDGSIRLKNKSGPENVEINLAAGKVWIDADVTDGIFNIRGVGEVVDNSTGTTVVNTDGLVNKAAIADAVWDELAADHNTALTMGEALNSAGGGSSPSAIADAVWDEVLTGGTHNINKSAGKILRGLGNLVVLTDTAQGPGVGPNQIQLHTGASAVDGGYDPALVAIVDGTGAGQSRLILQYDGATKVATVDRNWKVLPDSGSEFVIYADAGREHVNEGLAQGGTSTTITLNALASSVDNVYRYQTVFIRSGLGDDQVGIVTEYNGTTKVATIDGTWAIIPDTTSGYVMLPSHNNISVEQFSAYANQIVIDTANGVAGTEYPVGTLLNPVNNLTDAKTIAAVFGIEEFHIQGTLVVGATDNIDGLVLRGHNALVDTVVLTVGCSTVNTVFRNMRLTGCFAGGVFCEEVALISIIDIGDDTNPTLFKECILIEGTHTFKAGLTTPQNIQFVECVSGVKAGTGVILDFNGTTSRLAFRKYGGELSVINYTGGQSSVMELSEGELVLDATCTTGAIIGRGIGEVTDNSTGAFIFLNQMLDKSGIVGAVWDELAADHQIANSFGERIDLLLAKINALFGF